MDEIEVVDDINEIVENSLADGTNDIEIMTNVENNDNDNDKDESENIDHSGVEAESLQSEKRRLLKLPFSRIKSIIKFDQECQLVSQEATFLVTKATELFLEHLGKEILRHTQTAKRKTILKRDIDVAIESIPNLYFLDGALE